MTCAVKCASKPPDLGRLLQTHTFESAEPHRPRRTARPLPPLLSRPPDAGDARLGARFGHCVRHHHGRRRHRLRHHGGRRRCRGPFQPPALRPGQPERPDGTETPLEDVVTGSADPRYRPPRRRQLQRPLTASPPETAAYGTERAPACTSRLRVVPAHGQLGARHRSQAEVRELWAVRAAAQDRPARRCGTSPAPSLRSVVALGDAERECPAERAHDLGVVRCRGCVSGWFDFPGSGSGGGCRTIGEAELGEDVLDVGHPGKTQPLVGSW